MALFFNDLRDGHSAAPDDAACWDDGHAIARKMFYLNEIRFAEASVQGGDPLAGVVCEMVVTAHQTLSSREATVCYDRVLELADKAISIAKRQATEKAMSEESSESLMRALEMRRARGADVPLVTFVHGRAMFSSGFPVPEVPMNKDIWRMVLLLLWPKDRAALACVSKAACATVKSCSERLIVPLRLHPMAGLDSKGCAGVMEAHERKVVRDLVSGLHASGEHLAVNNCREICLRLLRVYGGGPFEVTLWSAKTIYSLKTLAKRVQSVRKLSLRLWYFADCEESLFSASPFGNLPHPFDSLADLMVAGGLSTRQGGRRTFDALVLDHICSAITIALAFVRWSLQGDGRSSWLIDVDAIVIDTAPQPSGGNEFPRDRPMVPDGRPVADEAHRWTVSQNGQLTTSSQSYAEFPRADLAMTDKYPPVFILAEVTLASLIALPMAQGFAEQLDRLRHFTNCRFFFEAVDVRIGDPRGKSPGQIEQMKRQPHGVFSEFLQLL